MPSLNDLVVRTKQMMMSFSQDQAQWTYNTATINPGDVSFVVYDATQVSRGLVEVGGQELMMVRQVSRQTNTVSLDPFGRGWNGTTATTWTANTQIENNPVFPYIRIKEAINDAVRSVYPDLFALSSTKITKVSVQEGYQLPADCEEIISVRFTTIGPTLKNPPMNRWRFDSLSDTSVFSTGKSIWLGVDVTPGREIFVAYRKEPSELVNPTDDFATVTGLPASCQDVIIMAACMKLAPSLEGPRMILDTVESSERAAFVQVGSAMRVSQAYAQLYEARLMQERKKLYDRYPQPSHFTQ